MLEHFAHPLGRPPHADAEDAYNALRTLDAILRGIVAGERICLN
ncbi:MAG: hypothetical protein QXI39_03720 [Candidatus Bathyarchaeia archaeon]